MRLLLRAHSVSLAFDRVVQPSLLRDLSTGTNDFNLPLNLVLQRLANKAERIHVLYFGLGAEFLFASRAHADVRISPQRTFFHVTVAHAGIKDDHL